MGLFDQFHALEVGAQHIARNAQQARGAHLVEVFPLVGGVDGVVDNMIEQAVAPFLEQAFEVAGEAILQIRRRGGMLTGRALDFGG